MSRPQRLIARAADAAALSYGVKRTLIGCVIARGNRILAVAANTSNNIPNNLVVLDGPMSRHAEVNALRMCEPRGADLYVVRVRANGDYQMAMPCQYCHKAIIKSGISRVFYTSWDGSIRVDRNLT